MNALIDMNPWPPDAITDPAVVEFKDEPQTWWWTNSSILLRGVGEKPIGLTLTVKASFAYTASLDVPRVQTTWHQCVWPRDEDDLVDAVRSTKSEFHGIQERYFKLVEFWPKPVKWLVPKTKEKWDAAALALEVESQQVVAVIMPVRGAEKWKMRKR